MRKTAGPVPGGEQGRDTREHFRQLRGHRKTAACGLRAVWPLTRTNGEPILHEERLPILRLLALRKVSPTEACARIAFRFEHTNAPPEANDHHAQRNCPP